MVVLHISNTGFDLEKLEKAIITGLEGDKDISINSDAANDEINIAIGSSTQEIHLGLTVHNVKADWNMT